MLDLTVPTLQAASIVLHRAPTDGRFNCTYLTGSLYSFTQSTC